MSKTAVVDKKTLPKKEADLFKQLVNCYETKQYKKGIKTADSILKKFPNSGETQAMKGIILNCMGKKEEAYELVKLGLRNDVRSHVCWHVYGLLYRSDNNYREAIKCYLNALRIDPGNQNILRDLSWLQVQMRDGPGFLATRRTILEGKPTIRASWVAFAVANYLTGDYESAVDVINKYQDGVADKAEPYEESELVLFQNSCLELDGKYEQALTHLTTKESMIMDKWSYKIKYAQLLTLSKNYTEALKHWEKLISEQPENYQFHSGLQLTLLESTPEIAANVFRTYTNDLPCNVLELSAEQQAKLIEWYNSHSFKSRAFTKIRLFVQRANTSEFQRQLEEFMKTNLVDGVPSLCNDVASFILVPNELQPGYLRSANDATEYKAHYIYTFTQNFLRDFVADYVNKVEVSAEQRKSPIAILWALYLQSHFYELAGDFPAAIEAIDAAITHTPTALDMIAKKAKLCKRVGDFATAASLMDSCRALDLQDRYLNNQTTKYCLQNNEIEKAMNTIAMFTKHEGDPQQTLFGLQASWYELELAEAYAREKNWGAALKKFDAIRKHFVEQYEDLFDFHGYCIRKTTLRAYMDVMKVQDSSFNHPFFQRALIGTLKIYLYLLDYPEDIDGLGHLSSQERKKERARRAKEKKQKDKEAADAKAKEAAELEAKKAAGSDDKEETTTEKKDEDPTGELYLQKDFLAEANNWCQMIHESSACPELLALMSDIWIRRNKYIHAVRAINIGLKQAPYHPDLVTMLMKLVVKFKAYLAKKLPTTNAAVSAIVKQEIALLVGGDNQTANVAYLEKYAAYINANRTSSTAYSLQNIFGLIRAQGWILKGVPPATALLTEEALWTSARGSAFWPLVAEVVKYLKANHEQEPFTTVFIDHAKQHYPNSFKFLESNKTETTEGTATATAATTGSEETAPETVA